MKKKEKSGVGTKKKLKKLTISDLKKASGALVDDGEPRYCPSGEDCKANTKSGVE
jgi:hypothetical protein